MQRNARNLGNSKGNLAAPGTVCDKPAVTTKVNFDIASLGVAMYHRLIDLHQFARAESALGVSALGHSEDPLVPDAAVVDGEAK